MARKKYLTEDQIQEILDLYKTREFSKNEIAMAGLEFQFHGLHI